ncbi:Gar1/Naf1 RNA binding region-domain-containing protein [Pholiota molesta]|nr:Gar1/Naf1 RNA binding region-domain-containing protein [Pholiota molesta]
MSRGGRAPRGGGRGGYQQRDFGPPDQKFQPSKRSPKSSSRNGTFVHAVEDEMLCSSLIPDKVPYFNAPIYLQNKSQIGKVDEILGPINEVYFSIKMGEGMVYIGGDKLLPIERFLPKPKVAGGVTSKRRLFIQYIYSNLILLFRTWSWRTWWATRTWWPRCPRRAWWIPIEGWR